MNRDKRAWKMICLIMALSVFFVAMTEVRPNRFSKPLVKRENIHVFTEVKHVPDLAFFWNMSQKISHDNRRLSDEQKAQMKEEFWKMFVQAVALQEDALSKNAEVSDEKGAALQRDTSASTQPIEYIFAGYLRASNDILTPEQQSRHDRHHSRPKMPGRFYVAEKFWALTVASGAPIETKSARSHAPAKEDTAGVTQQSAWATLAQISVPIPLQHDVSQLQILRL